MGGEENPTASCGQPGGGARVGNEGEDDRQMWTSADHEYTIGWINQIGRTVAMRLRLIAQVLPYDCFCLDDETLRLRSGQASSMHEFSIE